jgi:serine phosphatase RsbU (regulator of sigma subunit)
MEIWGGNRAIDRSFEAPGIDIYVHSAPFQASHTGGGDIYYVTSCASGRITRLLLADVSGHGAPASKLAVSLRDLLRANVNTINQEKFFKEMNLEFGRLAEESCFATAVVATYFEPRKSLSFGLAGHPYPFYYRASMKRWVHLDPKLEGSELGNLPLGVHENASYPGTTIQVQTGDRFLLYSDAFIESVNRNKQQLGMSGILELLNEMPDVSADEIIPFVRKTVGEMSERNLVDDDETIILGHVTPTKVRVRDNILAPFRLFGGVNDNTRLSTLAANDD